MCHTNNKACHPKKKTGIIKRITFAVDRTLVVMVCPNFRSKWRFYQGTGLHREHIGVSANSESSWNENNFVHQLLSRKCMLSAILPLKFPTAWFKAEACLHRRVYKALRIPMYGRRDTLTSSADTPKRSVLNSSTHQ